MANSYIILAYLTSLALATQMNLGSNYYEDDRPTNSKVVFSLRLTMQQEVQRTDGELRTTLPTFSASPSGQLIDPVMRTGTSATEFNRSPCGFQPQGVVSYEGFPGKQNEVAWLINEPSQNGKCMVKLNSEFEEDMISFQTLFPVDGSADINGKFPCGREGRNQFERKVFNFPKVTCNPCILQWTFETTKGIIYQCSDIALIDKESKNCSGRCQHQGVCKNGVCMCRLGFKGDYCENPTKTIETHFPIWTFLLIILLLVLIVAAIAVSYYYLMIKKGEKDGRGQLAN